MDTDPKNNSSNNPFSSLNINTLVDFCSQIPNASLTNLFHQNHQLDTDFNFDDIVFQNQNQKIDLSNISASSLLDPSAPTSITAKKLKRSHDSNTSIDSGHLSHSKKKRDSLAVSSFSSDNNSCSDHNSDSGHSDEKNSQRNISIQSSTSVLSSPVEDNLSLGVERTGSKKTAYNEKWGVKVLKAWCIETGINTEFETLEPEKLDEILTQFWQEVRKANGDYYGRNSLFNLRAMINKHLKGRPYNVNFDIVTDERFRTSNERLEKQLKLLKGIGRTITHKQPISIQDLRRMYDSGVLGTSNPLALLRKVWFEITLHFCHKGSESQEKLLKSSFEIYRDVTGRAYVARARPKDGQQSPYDDIRMYETGGDLCPIKSYQLYLMKLHPLQPRLFQQPRRKALPESPMWYGKAPIGEKALQQMMANLSAAAKLDKRYTNHCVRTTALEQFSSSKNKQKKLLLPVPQIKSDQLYLQQQILQQQQRAWLQQQAYQQHMSIKQEYPEVKQEPRNICSGTETSSATNSENNSEEEIGDIFKQDRRLSLGDKNIDDIMNDDFQQDFKGLSVEQLAMLGNHL